MRAGSVQSDRGHANSKGTRAKRAHARPPRDLRKVRRGADNHHGERSFGRQFLDSAGCVGRTGRNNGKIRRGRQAAISE